MEKDNRQISGKIEKWNKEYVDNKNKIFFEITVEFIYNKWTLQKRYSEFETLQKSLRQTFAHLPSLPGKSLFKLKKDADIEKRKVKLDFYIKELVKRSEIYSDSNFIQFFQVSLTRNGSNSLARGEPAGHHHQPDGAGGQPLSRALRVQRCDPLEGARRALHPH
jgi:hypothetical protein